MHDRGIVLHFDAVTSRLTGSSQFTSKVNGEILKMSALYAVHILVTGERLTKKKLRVLCR